MKCLEKDPARRFSSAAALADELGRFQRGEPIRARPIGRVARLGKWVKRRPHQAALAVLGTLALTGAFIGLVIHQARLKVEIDRTARAAEYAHTQKLIADSNYKEARATIKAMLDCYNDPAFSTVRRRGQLQRAQAEKALGFYDRLLAVSETSDPVVQLDTARAAREAATIQYSAGRFEQAMATLEHSMRLIDAVLLKQPGDREVRRQQLLSRTKLGLILWRIRKNPSRALSELSRAVADAEQLVREDPRSVDARSDLAWSLHDQGSILIETGRTQDALAAHRRASEINRVLCDERAGDLPRRAALAENLNNLGLSTDVSDPKLAEKSYSEAVSILEDIVRQSTNLRWVTSLGSTLNNQGNLAQSLGQPDRAYQCFQRGLALLDDALEREPGETILRYTALNLHGSRRTCLPRSAATLRRSRTGTRSTSSTTSPPIASPIASCAFSSFSGRRTIVEASRRPSLSRRSNPIRASLPGPISTTTHAYSAWRQSLPRLMIAWAVRSVVVTPDRTPTPP